MSPPNSFRANFARLPFLGRANFLALGALTLVLILLLGPEWLHNPDLSHGLFMPAVFVFLLYESRSGRPGRYLPAGPWVAAAATALAATAIGILALAGLYAAVLDWSHALVLFLLSCAATFLLGAGLVTAADARVRLFPLNWASLAAVVLWPLSAPIPPGTYSRLTVALQLRVTAAVLQALHLLGIAAFRNGNILELARTTVGVEEACSGVRSLISCLFAGLFLSASVVSRPGARILIVALAGPLALAMNFVRSLLLTLLANAGVQIGGFWHEVTGYAVLGVTAALLAVISLWLERGAPERTGDDAVVPDESGAAPRQLPLAGALLLTAAVALFFYHNTRRSPAAIPGAGPDLWALLPASAASWRVVTTNDLYKYADTLRTKDLAQRMYLRTRAGATTEITLYLAYWKPGQAPVSLVASHTPDTCWPGSGWVLHPPPVAENHFAVGGRSLAAPEAEYFENSGNPQYVWFWHLYAGRPIPYENPYSIRRLLDIAWNYGFQHDGEQLFVRVSSNRPWAEISGEPLVQGLFGELRSEGL